MTRPADSWASAMSTTARPFGSHAYKPCGSSTVTAPPRVPTRQRPGGHGHSPRGSGSEHAPVQLGDDLAGGGDRAVLPGVEVAEVVTGEVHVPLRRVERRVRRCVGTAGHGVPGAFEVGDELPLVGVGRGEFAAVLAAVDLDALVEGAFEALGRSEGRVRVGVGAGVVVADDQAALAEVAVGRVPDVVEV